MRLLAICALIALTTLNPIKDNKIHSCPIKNNYKIEYNINKNQNIRKFNDKGFTIKAPEHIDDKMIIPYQDDNLDNLEENEYKIIFL